MNWTKPNFTQWVTIVTLVCSAAGYVWHSESERVDQKIKQHDQDQRVDSIATAFAIFVTEFKELRKNREVSTKQRDEEKKEDDERTERLDVRVTVIETEFHDYLKYKKQQP